MQCRRRRLSLKLCLTKFCSERIPSDFQGEGRVHKVSRNSGKPVILFVHSHYGSLYGTADKTDGENMKHP